MNNNAQPEPYFAKPMASEEFWAEADELAVALAAHLNYLEALGAGGVPKDFFSDLSAPVKENIRVKAKPVEQRKEAAAASRNITDAAASGEKRFAEQEDKPSDWAPGAADLNALSRLAAKCGSCALAQARCREPIMGQGSHSPMVVAVGPTPAIFHAEKGELLKAIMEKGLELSPEEYYSTSLLKCAAAEDMPPPDGADDCCWPILRRQLDILAPKTVLVLGKKTAQQITGLHGEPLGLLRPQTHRLPGLDAFIRVTYGLEDMINNLKLKKAAWLDLKRVREGLKKIKR